MNGRTFLSSMQGKMNQYNDFYKDRNVTSSDEKCSRENEDEVDLL